MPFVSTNNNHANQKTTCLLSFQSHVSCFLKYVLSLIQKMLLWSCLFWETEDKKWKLSGRTLSVSDIACVASVSAGVVSEQKKTVERDFRFWPRENWNENQKMSYSSFFAPEPHRNACYAGYKRHLVSYLRRLHKISFQLAYKLCIFTFPLALGCPLKRAFAVLSFIKKFSSKLALRTRFAHPPATVTHSKKDQIFSLLSV